uniref:NADH dehydrogenase subunit 5 n=1 Tax=Dactylogyrus tuba TaxID=231340 RepID=UPI002E788621|nr:NADH dehydrogenase subunit 5 [Dactylogyrus tuba]WCF76303.1 NADH dehydrogenase subunit 5 [Dactylogyrus tuba]
MGFLFIIAGITFFSGLWLAPTGEMILCGKAGWFGSLEYPVCSTFTEVEFLCLAMLAVCGGISLHFSKHYFGWSQSNLGLLVLGFISVMAILVTTGDMWTTLVLWEYLGFISFLLILYYGTSDTAYAANATLVTSRFGDVGLFLLLASAMVGVENWVAAMTGICLFMIIATKSAVIPFSSWLLEAMRAPTPVSCLVHSSTLVAAGVWFSCQYGHLLASSVSDWLGLACLVTVVVSASSALYFSDVKKIVALSTCNNIAWCVVYYLMGSKLLCAVQLVSHGVAKCMLFMGVGDALSSSFSSQNNTHLLSYGNVAPSGWFWTSALVLIIAGVPFNGVFFSKHLLLAASSSHLNPVVGLLVGYGVYLTYFYSGRLLFLISNPPGGISNSLYTLFTPVGLLVGLGGIVNYTAAFSLEEPVPLGVACSVMVVAAQALGLIRGLAYASFQREAGWYSLFLGQDIVVKSSIAAWGHLGHYLISFIQARWEVGTGASAAKSLKDGSSNLLSGLPVLLGLLMMLCLWFFY